MKDTPRSAAARYQMEQAARADGHDVETPEERREREEKRASVDQSVIVEGEIQQAIRRGEFDDLPGAGKPLEHLGGPHDPDWWIRKKIEEEHLTGLGPPALTLRKEDAELDERLDALPGEADVRHALEDFNQRVIEARRQLQGGPPVVTPTRDVEAEVRAWAERARQRHDAAELDRRENLDRQENRNQRENGTRRKRRHFLGRSRRA